ncbi:MAG: hypothetical protein LW826_05455, partial [Candidatus Jidaibacter sp.]|nr:hypothetical protein [Candidatus Jidaibacter sp.]
VCIKIIHHISYFSVSNLHRYSGFRSLKSEGLKSTDRLKARSIEGFGTCVSSRPVFPCIGDGEAKNGDFGCQMVKLEKARYGSNAESKSWKAGR